MQTSFGYLQCKMNSFLQLYSKFPKGKKKIQYNILLIVKTSPFLSRRYLTSPDKSDKILLTYFINSCRYSLG